MNIQNPILSGFNPDPSVCRVGNDYYIACSTFEWFPGVQIHHSRDLANWELIGRPLNRTSQLNMLGNPDSAGIWAPDLSYADGKFWLLYTDTKMWHPGPYKITPNYLVTADDIRGPWSDPVFLNSSGFDPSLFHAEDGRKWLLNMRWDHRKGKHPFRDIVLQEYSVAEGKLIGDAVPVFTGSSIAKTEGPHLYMRNGWYYLLTAEGGTSYEHAATIARSRNLEGPYEIHPANPLITSDGNDALSLQKSGHASLVDTTEGEWFAVHLCGRPLSNRRCILGRETAIQKTEWKTDDWPYLAQGGNFPSDTCPLPSGVIPGPRPSGSQRVDFAPGAMDLHFQSLRRPIDASWVSTDVRPGWLRLYGQEPTVSLFRQSLLARRVQAFHTVTTICMEYQPRHYQHMAGLIAYYDRLLHYYLRVTYDEADGGRTLGIIKADLDIHEDMPEYETKIPGEGSVFLQVDINRESLLFRYSLDGATWVDIGPVLDASILSDDYGTLGFTGAFVGMACQDISGMNHPADFRFFDYQEKD